MEVRLVPNSFRPGVGQKPRRENTRPLLPQHARHCPVLEAGSAAGFMVYAPLDPKESYYVEYEGDGRYKFVYYLQGEAGKQAPIFSVSITMSLGAVGFMKEEVEFLDKTIAARLTREDALKVARVFLIVPDMGTPPGALALRGAWNFRTPKGWDTLYTPIFNMIERPMAPMLIVRVETDWFPHDSEFRYVMQPGEGITVSHTLPIGQVLFLPREEITLKEASPEEIEAFREGQRQFVREKASVAQKTSYGLTFSPHYLRRSRQHKDG